MRVAHAVRSGGRLEHMAGYGLIGLSFESGHVLAFRRFAASSIGPPYVSLWIRDPRGRWEIHTNVEPDRACPRYFGPALHAAHVSDIGITWQAPRELTISAPRAGIHLTLRLAASSRAALLGAVSRHAPDILLKSRRAGGLAGRMLGAGSLTLAGTAPAGHQFVIRPHALWHVAAAAAVVGGHDCGPVALPATQPSLGDFMVPLRGVFACGEVTFSRNGAATDSGRSRAAVRAEQSP